MSKEEIVDRIEDVVIAYISDNYNGVVAEKESEKLATELLEKLSLEKSELIAEFVDYVKEESGIEIPKCLFIKFLELEL